MKTITTYIVNLDVWFRRDGRTWLASCPCIDVVTQASTKKEALIDIQEAVSLWFQSCIDRNVLREALVELGFKSSPWDKKSESLPKSNFIAIEEFPLEEVPKKDVSFSIDSQKNSIKGIIPAYIAKKQLGEFIHEAR